MEYLLTCELQDNIVAPDLGNQTLELSVGEN